MPESGWGAGMQSPRTPLASARRDRSESPMDAVVQLALAFDYGTRRVGVAIGSQHTGGARPLCSIGAAPTSLWPAIGRLVEQWSPSVLVVGVPRHPDGAAHRMTVRCERFARQLQGRIGLPVECVDERYSSAVVGQARARDQDAAAVILQQWFDERAVRIAGVAGGLVSRSESPGR
jgi:putative holliday junction resolvase